MPHSIPEDKNSSIKSETQHQSDPEQAAMMDYTTGKP